MPKRPNDISNHYKLAVRLSLGCASPAAALARCEGGADPSLTLPPRRRGSSLVAMRRSTNRLISCSGTRTVAARRCAWHRGSSSSGAAWRPAGRRRRRPPADLLQVIGGSPEPLRPREGVGEEAADARHLVPREVHEPRPVVAAAPVPPGGAVETRPPPGVDGRVQVVLDGA